MIINNLQFYEINDHVVLSASCNIRYFGKDIIYFKVQKTYKDFVCVDYTPFITSLLIPAMKLGDNVYVNGPVSKKVYLNMEKIMDILVSWNLGLKKIKIEVKSFTDEDVSPKYSSSFFSGGVDSFYTFLNNKKNNNLIDYLILANGYDINLKNDYLWRVTKENVIEISKEQSVNLIEIESNIRDLIEPIMPWGYTHGGCLVALGLLLRKKIKSVYIPSSYNMDQLFRWGTHPELDHLWSSEFTNFIHDGADKTRLEKIKIISNNPSFLDHLRVCYLNKKGKFNCGVCDKCLRTMIALKIVGNLDKSKTFPNFIDINVLNKINIEGHSGSVFHAENLKELKRLNIYPEIQEILDKKIKNIRNEGDSFFVELLKKIWFIDHYYLRGFIYKIISMNRY